MHMTVSRNARSKKLSETSLFLYVLKHTFVLLERMLQFLRLFGDFPHTHLAVDTTTHNAKVTALINRASDSNRSDAVLVCIVDGVEQAARLRTECANLTITPTYGNITAAS